MNPGEIQVSNSLREKLGELLAGKVTPEQAKSFASNLLQTLMEGPPDGDEAQA
jgi:hypothetical protein